MAKFYERYWKNEKGHLGDFELKWPLLSRFIPTDEGISIFDFGCGNASVMVEMKKLNPKAHYYGVDVSEEALSEAKVKMPEAEFLHIEDGGEFGMKDGVVDFVFTSEVIEHVYDTENAAKEIARVMKRGAKLLLTTPYHGFLKNLALVLFGFDKHFDPVGPHVRFFSKKTLCALFEKYGVETKKVFYYGRFYPFSHSIVIYAEKK